MARCWPAVQICCDWRANKRQERRLAAGGGPDTDITCWMLFVGIGLAFDGLRRGCLLPEVDKLVKDALWRAAAHGRLRRVSNDETAVIWDS